MFKAFFSGIRTLTLGLISKSHRGVEWHRLTHDRFPWIVALVTLVMILVMIRIVLFILSPDGAEYARRAASVNPPRQVREEPMRGSIHARDGRPIAVTSPIYRLFIDFRAEALAPLRKPLPPRGGSKKDSLQRAKVLELRAEFDAGLDSLAELMATTFDLSARKLTKGKLKERWRRAFSIGDRHCAVYPADVTYVQYKAFENAAPFDQEGRYSL